MADATNDLRVLLANIPRESLDLELKQWIDPKKNEGIAKIAKGCIALRNNNGGRLVIGFKNDGSPDTNVPPDVRGTFHTDQVQSIVSSYSSEQFAVEVQFVDVGPQIYPVIVVPPGVRTPVAAKSTLNGSDGKPLVRDHVVYVRSLHSNNTVSSTEARRGDWETLTRICFDNREADIGGFVRRHLAALNLEALAEMISSLRSLKHPSEVERVTAELDRGRSQFDAEVKKRGVRLPTPLGFRDSTILVDGEFPKQDTTESFRRNLLFRAPRHTGWPPWVEIDRQPHRPYVFDNGWEALLIDLDATRSPRPEVDFWRMEPQGIFYQIRALEDDLAGDIGPTPCTQLDFLLQISRTAEIISTGLSFGRSLGCDEGSTSLVFGFRWTGLEGRQLTSWADPRRRIYQLGEARQDQITTTVTVPLMTPPNGVAPHVENAVRSLFTLFGGTVFESNVVEGIVSEALQRRW